MNINTHNHGYNVYDGGDVWTATDDDTYDGAPDSNCPVGWGMTEREAINNLVEQIVERLEDSIDGLRWENRALRAEIRGMMVTYGEIPPRTSHDVDRQRVFPWQVMSGQPEESSSPPRGAQEEDREDTRRFQGRMADERPEWDSGYDEPSPDR